MKRAILILLMLALTGHARLHLAGLQVVAWSGMILTYSQSASLSEAIEMTFDGEHPCTLCHIVSDAASASNPEFTAPAPAQPLLLVAERGPAWTYIPLLCHDAVIDFTQMAAAEPSRPPLPPPRGLA